MVTINYQMFGSKGFQLRLRIYQGGETKYVNVTKMLVGNIQKKHWNAKRQYFVPSCPFADENNETLLRVRRQYEERLSGWGGSIHGLVASVKNEADKGAVPSGLDEFICQFIEEKKRKKHADGTMKGTYENYVKLRKRLEEYCDYAGMKYGKLKVVDVNEWFVSGLFEWIGRKKRGAGMMYVSKTLHAVLVAAEKRGIYDMGCVKNCDWKKEKRVSAEVNHTLSDSQCKRLKEMPIHELPSNPKSNLYRDFCVFLLCTGQSPCDAITLKRSDVSVINGVEYIVFKRRKIAHKQEKPCSIPVSKTMKAIIEKWRRISSDGYIFPIRNKRKLATQKTNNGDIKHFICRLNLWLKKVGVLLGCDFKLHTYTFRHTAITHYISKGVPVAYVADIMGTSVENCEHIYYNSLGDLNSRKKVLDVSY